MKISYPFDQANLVQLLKLRLDETFCEARTVHTNVLQPIQVMKSVTNVNNLRQVYTFEDKVLRFDHTHGNLKRPLKVPEKIFGPVFRRGASYKGRYREFYQYDVDYPFKEYGLYPLTKLIRFFKVKDFKFVINDLNLLEEELRRKDPTVTVKLSEDDPFLMKRIETLDIQQFSRRTYERYPQLKEFAEVDPTLIRGWDYYQHLVFEVKPRGTSASVVGGGLYRRNHLLHLGFGIGLSRLVHVLKSLNLLQQYLPLRKLVSIVYQGFPVNLVTRLDLEHVPYLLSPKEGPLIKTCKNLEKALKGSRDFIALTLVVGESEDVTGVYIYKAPKEPSVKVNLDQLVSIVKTACF